MHGDARSHTRVGAKRRHAIPSGSAEGECGGGGDPLRGGPPCGRVASGPCRVRIPPATRCGGPFIRRPRGRPMIHTPRDAVEEKGPQRRPQKRLDTRLEEVAKAVGGDYCRLQMPLKLALAVRETVAGHGRGTLEGGAPPVPMHPCTHTPLPVWEQRARGLWPSQSMVPAVRGFGAFV